MSALFSNLVSTLPALLAALALAAGGALLIASALRTRDEALARRVAMVEPRGTKFTRRGAPTGTAESLFRLPEGALSAASQREVGRMFSGLGLSPARALTAFTMMRLVVVAVLGIGTFLWLRGFGAFANTPLLPVLLAAMVAIGGWFLPMTIVSYRLKQRTKAVRSGLPDALELLVVCVEAGLSLEDGLDRVVTELKRSQPALADELNLTLADLRILPSRDQALANLAERVDVPSVRSVVTTLAQTLRYGTPLVQALRVTSAELRNDSLIELEERANRLPAYLTLPVIVFLMPTIFLIVGGPAALRLIDVFMHR
ncbi:type II secretion system F family protein [Pseudolabrys taiwanensis]|uniref:Type II secretion system F family protein n=1 Tax=Pseudolabrys taiwanensis TaxID=331696 RepID=A0A346A177_9HYPH|nr:type II secretion system F family protein [Pseudolabrys taiwanensis]AXK82924.1 type II secretion system F family protein [Pseudolabrys taiwanensis]